MTILNLEVLAQPNDSTCGPTSLHAVYRYYGDHLPLAQLIGEIDTVRGGGTLAVLLGCHALTRGYKVTIYTYNLQVFDPTWFASPAIDISEKLRQQAEAKDDEKLRQATGAYREFLARGGRVKYEDLTPDLLVRYLERGVPILTGLSSTNLYRASRECGSADEPDDVRGHPVGHFVILAGYQSEAREVLVADPWHPNPVSLKRDYWVNEQRLINSVLLGILTYDANLLIIERDERDGVESSGVGKG